MPDLHLTVQGNCPACRGESLFLGSGGYVTCARLDCPDPEAATRILEQRIDYSKIRFISAWYPACPEGRHPQHPDCTCDEADRLAAAGRKFMTDAANTIDAMTTEVPAALRGPHWKDRP